jgi:hypothetical protein
MEKSYIPKLRYPDYESEIIGKSKKSIYTDTDRGCVYLKKEGEVSSYLLENYDIKKLQNNNSLDKLLNSLQKQYNDDINNSVSDSKIVYSMDTFVENL